MDLQEAACAQGVKYFLSIINTSHNFEELIFRRLRPLIFLSCTTHPLIRAYALSTNEQVYHFWHIITVDDGGIAGGTAGGLALSLTSTFTI